MSSETVKQVQQAQAPAHAAPSATWVGAWYAAPSRVLSAGLAGRTFRQIVHLHAGGEQLRLRLPNRYGDGPITLSSIPVGQVLQGPVVSTGARAIRFARQATVTLEAGQEVVSDPVALRMEAESDLAITCGLAQGESLTGHWSAQQTSYVSGLGNVTAAPADEGYRLIAEAVEISLLTGSPDRKA